MKIRKIVLYDGMDFPDDLSLANIIFKEQIRVLDTEHLVIWYLE